jgi:hypothetical protein
MRWDNLFDDLESQLEHELSAEDIDIRAEEERLRLGRLALRDRVLAVSARAPGEGIRFELVTGQSMVALPTSHGRDWFFVEHVTETGRRMHAIIPLFSIASIVMNAEQVEASVATAGSEGFPDASTLSDRLGLSFVLRDICRRRSAVEVKTISGVHYGTIDRVGRDHIDLAEHERGVSRRASAVFQFRAIPLTQIVMVVL